MQVYEVLSVCTVATTYYNTMSWHYEEIKSSVAWFSPIKLHKPTIASDPTHCACAHDMSIRPIQVEVTLYLGQTDPGSWDVESAYCYKYNIKYIIMLTDWIFAKVGIFTELSKWWLHWYNYCDFVMLYVYMVIYYIYCFTGYWSNAWRAQHTVWDIITFKWIY